MTEPMTVEAARQAVEFAAVAFSMADTDADATNQGKRLRAALDTLIAAARAEGRREAEQDARYRAEEGR